MKIESVALRHVDPSCGRLAEIRTSKGTISTPCQIANQNERSALIAERLEPVPVKHIQLQTDIDRARLRSLKNNPEHLDNSIRYFKKRCDPFEIKSLLPRLDNGIRELTPEDMSFLISLQVAAEMDMAYYPYERISTPRFASKFDMLRDENPSQEITPVLDLDESSNVFKSKFEHLVDVGCRSLVLWYQGLTDSRSNLFYIKHKARDLQMWTILANHPQKYSRKIPASFAHILPWHGIDSYVKQVAGYPSYLLRNGASDLPPRSPDSISFLGRKTYGVLKYAEFQAEREDLGACPCSQLHGDSIAHMMSDVDRAARLSRIHGLIEGEAILDEMKTPIRERRLSAFLKKKKYPNMAVKFDTLDTLLP